MRKPTMAILFTTFVCSTALAQPPARKFDDPGVPPFKVLNTLQVNSGPIYRMYNTNSGRHYYTAASGERDILKTLGWVYEKDEGFIYTTPVPGSTELFKLYNTGSGVHLYTIRPEEKNAILAQFPGIWVQHTSLGYALP